MYRYYYSILLEPVFVYHIKQNITILLFNISVSIWNGFLCFFKTVFTKMCINKIFKLAHNECSVAWPTLNDVSNVLAMNRVKWKTFLPQNRYFVICTKFLLFRIFFYNLQTFLFPLPFRHFDFILSNFRDIIKGGIQGEK